MSTTSEITKTLVIPEAPSIPGLSFRFFQGECDYPKIKAVFDSCKPVDDLQYSLTIEAIAHNFEHMQRCDPFTDMIMVEVNGDTIGYSRVWWYPEENGDYVYAALGWITPEWRRRGIGTAILQHNERRLREIAAGHPPGATKWLQNDYESQQVGVAVLLENNAYEAMRWGYRMSRPVGAPLPDAPIPAGLVVRAVDDLHVRPIWEALMDAFSENWGFVRGDEGEYQRWIASPTYYPDLWKVAWDGDQVAGMVLNFVNEAEFEEYGIRRGWTDPVCVRKPWRRRGLARSLLVLSILMFREMGFDQTVLGVDTQNPNHALDLYESVGYRVERKGVVCRKPLD